ncbi:hypothetical protein ET445_03695 [Agromyces protaetiae]|uniref:Uncharacterized protein n=1 Tax=Agromyces protaetiae TaxID=2509455 RepID=A0A4P6F9K0_9MICO|nr:hypothetical protein [Agromyces protaetiae]QAY72582.1 hypothetical protein ET445_03695 [Agromyces protaetiae]
MTQEQGGRTEQINVPVPAERVGEFFRWFADWLELRADGPVRADSQGPSRADASGPRRPQEDGDLVSRGAQWWQLLTSSERTIWSMWIDASPGLVSAHEIVERLGLRDADSIRGKINRFAGKGASVGFPVGWQSHAIDPDSGEKLYGIRDMNEKPYDPKPGLAAKEYTTILREARALAEDQETDEKNQ